MQQARLLELHKRRNFSDKISASIDFIRLHAKPFFKSMLFISGPFVLLGAILMAEGYSSMLNFGALSDPGTAAMVGENFFGYTMPMIAGLLFMFISGTLLIATVYQYVKIYDQKQSTDISVSEVWQGVKSFVWPVLGSLIIFAVVFGLIYFGGIMLAVGVGMASVFFAVIGGILLFCLLMYIGVVYSLVFPIQAFDQKDVFSALTRSLRLIKDKWWSTFGLIIICSVMQTFITYIFMIPWYAVLIAGNLHSLETSALAEPSLVYRIANYTTLSFGFLGGQLLYSFPLLAIAFQYFNLVELKEARGLMNKIETFGQEDTSNKDEEHY